MDAGAGESKEVVTVPVRQDDDGCSGDCGEVEVDGANGNGGGDNGAAAGSSRPQALQVKSEPGDTKEKTLLTYNRRKSSSSSAPAATSPPALVTPKLEETSNTRPVRSNRGIKRRYPGDESDETETSRKPARVRSMTEVFAETAKYSPQNGKEFGQRAPKRMRPKKRGRPARANGTRKGFTGSSESSDHPHQGNLYVCKHEGCDKVFTEPGGLYRHSRVHGDRPYVCHYEGCNRRFLERSKLKRHYLIHTGEKSFVCLHEGCGKAFSLDFNLRSHMKTHTGEYHECPHEGCEKKYCQNYKLRAHMCKDHNMVDGNDVLLDALKDLTPEMKAAKKQEKLKMLLTRKERLDKWREDRRQRIQELEVELERETKELGKIEKAMKRLDREKDQLDVDDESSELSSSDDSIEPDIEQATCEDREVLVFAQKLPTADHGARLVQADPRMMLSSDVIVSRPSSNSSSGFLLTSSLEKSSAAKIVDNVGGGGGGNLSGSWSNPAAGLSQNGDAAVWPSSSSSSSHKMILLQQSELPVTHLFAFQEQPCLVD